MTFRHLTLAIACSAALAGLAACSDATSDAGESKPVNAPVEDERSTEQPAAREEIKKSATVTNESYGSSGSGDSDIRGTVTITARTATEAPDDNDHAFSGAVILKDGSKVTCEEHRPFIWSDFGVWEDINLPCEKKLPLDNVVRFVVAD